MCATVSGSPLFFCLFGTVDKTQGLLHANQVFFHRATRQPQPILIYLLECCFSWSEHTCKHVQVDAIYGQSSIYRSHIVFRWMQSMANAVLTDPIFINISIYLLIIIYLCLHRKGIIPIWL